MVGFFCGNDVMEMVAEFARPGGNITGVSCLATELAVKRFDLLRDALPRMRKVGFFCDARNPGKLKELADVRRAAEASGIAVIAGPADSVDDIARCIASLKSAGAEALLISEDVFTFGGEVQAAPRAAISMKTGPPKEPCAA